MAEDERQEAPKEAQEQDPSGGALAPAAQGPQSLSEALKEADENPKSLLWLILLLTGLFGVGVYDFSLGAGPNRCAMTYMYEYPRYVPVPLPQDVRERFPKYGLYVYGEGEMVKELSKRGHTGGIPVLFVPGNSGSHKQVRSLASVALRKAEDDDHRFHFNFFTVDFNEEFGALYGGTLEDQADFVALCVDHVLGLYGGGGKKGKSSKVSPPESVVLVGHSIGGMLAKSLFSREDFDSRKISTVITLATPHSPVLVMDWETRAFYDSVDQHWNATRDKELKDVTLVSVGGGERDIQVRSGLTRSPHADVNVVGTAVPGAWVSTDHRCIAWCKQIVLSVVRALFDAVDRGSNQMTKIASYRRSVFKYHLAERNAGKRYKNKDVFLPKTVEFNKDGFWSDSMKRQFVFERTKVSEDSHIMIRMFDDPKHKDVFIDAINVEGDNWLFGCKATKILKNTRLCETGENLSHLTRLLPSAEDHPRKSVLLDLHAMAKEHGYTHLVVRVPRGSEMVRVHVDVFNRQAGKDDDQTKGGGALRRSFQVEVPRWISFWKRHTLVPRTHPQAVFYNFSMGGLTEPWQAYDVHVTRLDGCKEEASLGLMSFVTHWADDATWEGVGDNVTSTITAMLQTPASEVMEGDGAEQESRNPEVQLMLSPTCQYKVEIQSNLPKMWGQMIRFYAPLMLPQTVAACLLTLVQQLVQFHKMGSFPSFLSISTSRVTPISVVMPSKILSAVLSSAYLASLAPVTDFVRLQREGVDFGVLPILLFFVSIGLVTVVAFAAWACVVVFGRAAHKVAVGFFAARVPAVPVAAGEMVAEAALSGLSKVPIFLSAFLIALAASTCGTVALCLGTFVHLVQVFGLYKDYLKLLLKDGGSDEEAKKRLEERKQRAMDSLHFQFTIALLWTLTAVANAPSLMAWARNLQWAVDHAPPSSSGGGRLSFSVSRLDPDPSLAVTVAMASAMVATWGDRAPRARAAFTNRLAQALQFCCILIVLYGSVSLYRLNYFLAAAFAVLGLHQLLAREMTKEEVDEREKNAVKQKESAQQPAGQISSEATSPTSTGQSTDSGTGSEN